MGNNTKKHFIGNAAINRVYKNGLHVKCSGEGLLLVANKFSLWARWCPWRWRCRLVGVFSVPSVFALERIRESLAADLMVSDCCGPLTEWPVPRIQQMAISARESASLADSPSDGSLSEGLFITGSTLQSNDPLVSQTAVPPPPDWPTCYKWPWCKSIKPFMSWDTQKYKIHLLKMANNIH